MKCVLSKRISDVIAFLFLPELLNIPNILNIIKKFSVVKCHLYLKRQFRRNTDIFPLQTVGRTTACISGNKSKSVIHKIESIIIIRNDLLLFLTSFRFFLFFGFGCLSFRTSGIGNIFRYFTLNADFVLL